LIRFTYKAVDSAGFPRNGSLTAANQAQAIEQLFRDKLTPVSVSQEKSASGFSSSAGSGKLKQTDLVAFVREVATLLSSGVGLTDSFATLQEATTNPALKEALTRLIASVTQGEMFSVALRSAKLDLPEYVYALARAGEATGNIGAALLRCADQLEFDERMQSETREALIYPSILIFTGVAAIGFIFSFVVPRFAGLLAGRKVELPWLSSLVLSTGLFVNDHWVAFLLGAAALIGAGILVAKAPAARTAVTVFASRLPVFSTWMVGAETARWTSILAVLVQSRVPILLSLDLAAASVRLADNANRLRSMQDEVRLGKTLSQATEERRMLEGTPLSMLKVGEKTGDLAAMLVHIAAHAAERHRALQRRLVALIEPVSILFIGLVIGFIMVGVVLAMTSLTEVKL
jgi:general secretion pathway protein F